MTNLTQLFEIFNDHIFEIVHTKEFYLSKMLFLLLLIKNITRYVSVSYFETFYINKNTINVKIILVNNLKFRKNHVALM